jgi:hypothetical protein
VSHTDVPKGLMRYVKILKEMCESTHVLALQPQHVCVIECETSRQEAMASTHTLMLTASTACNQRMASALMSA